MTTSWGRNGLAAAALAAMSGCASVDESSPAAWRIEPLMRVTQSVASGHAYYLTGRYYDGMHDWPRAVDAYRKAVAADARHVEANNALGVALARLGRYDVAEAALRNALILDPSRAHLRSNLGYVLLLAGRAAEAVAELNAAVALDPADTVAHSNLREATALMAGAPPAPGPTVATPRAVATPASVERPVPPLAAAGKETLISEPTVSAWPLSDAPGNTARVAAASPTKVTPAEPIPAAVDPIPPVRLELSNGNGVTGAAARMREWLATQGVATRYLTNRQPYDQRRTVIEYRSGNEAAARRLAQVLPFPVETVVASRLRADLRVVLGHDWKPFASCFEPRGACPTVATVVAANDAAAEAHQASGSER